MTKLTVPAKAELQWAIPAELGIPPDPLRLRLDFFHQAVQMTYYTGDVVESKIVSANDVAIALANEISFHTGLLPDNALWWRNTRSGPIFALYEPPKIRTLALQLDIEKPPTRYKIPLPGFVFLAAPARPPWVFAVKRRPTKETDQIFHAPLLNIFNNGRSCGGSHKYPNRVGDVIESFFISFFSHTADKSNRSKRYPKDVMKLWEFLDKKKGYPMDDLIQFGVISDLMKMEMD